METEFKEKQKRKEYIESVLPAYQQAKQVHAQKYQESLNAETETARANLSFVSGIGLDALRQEGVNALLEQINHERNLRGDSPLGLEGKWDLRDQQELASTLERLIGKDPQVFMEDRDPPKLFPGADIASRLRTAGVLTDLGAIDRIKIEELMRGEKGEKRKEEMK